MLFKITLTLAIVGLLAPAPAQASNNFLESSHHAVSNETFQDDIINAMGSMLGCGSQPSSQKLASIQNTLEPMWKTLPKKDSRIDRRTLRYLVHRYFMKTSSLMIRGFEPTRSTNESHWGVADILSQMVPAYVESVLESQHAKILGFSFKDAVSMVVMLEQLVLDSEVSLLEKIYSDQGKPMHRTLSQNDLKKVLEAYMIDWMVDEDEETIKMLLANRSLMMDVVPHLEELELFAEGRMKSLQFARQQSIPKGHAKDTLEMTYAFEDAHAIVGGITSSFQAYWQSECDSMKMALVSMDTHNTGRVPLSTFYHTALNSDWRFGESESYLRELGALDESSSQVGPQVVIPNYIQATSNCIVTTPHYLVCCQNDCEALLGEVEVALGSPTAAPQDILPIVGNMSQLSSDDEEESPQLQGALTIQLQEIAKLQGGVVPLHGRLFAQWLHYVFPRECPFPHKTGAVSAVTPEQWGIEYVASQQDMRKSAAKTYEAVNVTVNKEELQWMSQWSPEEEFIFDYSSELGMSWERRMLLVIGGLVLLTFGISAGTIGYSRKAVINEKCFV